MSDAEREPKGEFVPWRTYMEGHLAHEKQIAMNTQRLADMAREMSDIKALAQDTNDKTTKHIADEDKIWAEFKTSFTDQQSSLKALGEKMGNPTISFRTMGTIIFSIVMLSGTVAYLLHFLGWPH